MKSIVSAVLVLLALCAVAQAGQLYRWVDPEGKVHYTDKLPPNNAKDVEKKRLVTQSGDAPVPYDLQQAMKLFPVTVFNADCGETCDAARHFLDKRGVPYTEKNGRDPGVQQELVKLVGAPEVPVMLVGRNVVKGYEETLWNQALDAANYPKTSRLPPKPPGAKPGPAKPTDTKTPVEAGEPPGEESPPAASTNRDDVATAEGKR